MLFNLHYIFGICNMLVDVELPLVEDNRSKLSKTHLRDAGLDINRLRHCGLYICKGCRRKALTPLFHINGAVTPFSGVPCTTEWAGWEQANQYTVKPANLPWKRPQPGRQPAPRCRRALHKERTASCSAGYVPIPRRWGGGGSDTDSSRSISRPSLR